MAKGNNITNLSSEEYVLKNGTDVPKVIDYGKGVSKIVFKDGTELDIDDTNKKYFKYKDNQIKLYKSVKELTLYGDVLWGALTIIETSDDALIDTIILNDVSGGLNTRNISVSCIKVKSIKSKFRNSFKINSNDLNLLEVYKKVDFGRLDVRLNSLKTLRNRGKIHQLEVKDITNFKTKNVGHVYLNKVCIADKDGNVIFLYDEDYENLMNKLKDYLKDVKNDEDNEVVVKFQYQGDGICIYSYDNIYLEQIGPKFFIDNSYELDIDKRDFLLYVDIYKRNYIIDKLLE